ncbi:response regulator [Bernardetia sp. Wsw4-3y2]|uniref:response regulator n=1 Tax=unclassified Bernardetia TaxID=2647129 RepID=UPI0030CE21B5
MANSTQNTDKISLVMLVDDNDTDNFISKRIIELTGFANEVVTKNSGKSALEYLKENKDDESKLPDLIFLDINMPIVDGFIFLYEFGQMPKSVHKKCRISVLSSSDNKRDIDRIVGNEYVIKFTTKPLTEDALNAVKDVWLKQK